MRLLSLHLRDQTWSPFHPYSAVCLFHGVVLNGPGGRQPPNACFDIFLAHYFNTLVVNIICALYCRYIYFGYPFAKLSRLINDYFCLSPPPHFPKPYTLSPSAFPEKFRSRQDAICKLVSSFIATCFKTLLGVCLSLASMVAFQVTTSAFYLQIIIT